MPITLTNPVVVSQGSNTIESDASAAANHIELNLDQGLAIIRFKNGTLAGGIFTAGTVAPGNVVVTINLITGDWTSSTGQSGTLSGVALQTGQQQVETYANGVESFATSQGIIPGTQVPWSSIQG